MNAKIKTSDSAGSVDRLAERLRGRNKNDQGEVERKGDVDIIHRYIDYTTEREFYGQTIISWENGFPVMVKENTTLKMDDIEKMVQD